MLKISALETENKDNIEKLESEMQKKVEEMDVLRREGEKREEHMDSLEKQVEQLHHIIEEKEQLILQCKEREMKLEQQFTENQVLLTAAESRLAEASKQYDVMLESKQLELSRHLKELSQRNDQAINDIRKKYEAEKLEIINMEKEKVSSFLYLFDTFNSESCLSSFSTFRQKKLLEKWKQNVTRKLQNAKKNQNST